ncbi:MAG: SET domain-containing protein-lysine N-methyltransferase [Chlamydiae bacterium]|nr:SET domain-containing protein-lysine N-methyltransferase [Chlamydiota bacterium]
MTKSKFKKFGLTFAPDLVVRPSDREPLRRAWKRASKSDLRDPEVKRMVSAIKSKKTAPIEVKEVKFKKDLQRGLFAAADIPKGAVIGHYSGKLMRMSAVNTASDYIFSFSEAPYRNWAIDGEKIGNYMRFINHSSKINIEPVELYYGGLPRIVFVAKRKIKKGEQLYYSYGPEYWKVKGVKPD